MATIIYKDKFKDRFSENQVVVERVKFSEKLRIILFFLKKGQIVDIHTSPLNVIVTVLEGSGKFFIGNKEEYRDLKAGDTLIYDPSEPHGFEATEDMIVQAVITG